MMVGYRSGRGEKGRLDAGRCRWDAGHSRKSIDEGRGAQKKRCPSTDTLHDTATGGVERLAGQNLLRG
jgi:hypothetical protein